MHGVEKVEEIPYLPAFFSVIVEDRNGSEHSIPFPLGLDPEDQGDRGDLRDRVFSQEVGRYDSQNSDIAVVGVQDDRADRTRTDQADIQEDKVGILHYGLEGSG